MASIITTLGPATEDIESIEKLYKSGVRVLRFNFPHAKYEWILGIKEKIKEIEQKIGGKFMLLCDTEGPGIRLGNIRGSLGFKKGDVFKMCVDKKYIDEKKTIACNYPYLVQDSKVGDIIKIDAGLFDVQVVRKTKNYLYVKSLQDGVLTSQRHVNLPRKKLKLKALSKKDKEDILFCIEQNFAYVAMSFVKTAQDIRDLRNFLYDHGASHLKIIAKIETQDAIDNISEIIRVSDAVMVARGDLGTEMPIETIPGIQQYIVDKTKRKGKKVIVATQMLESMIKNTIPTRAEVSDIFSAVREGADFVMLSGETAIGKNPIECVRVVNSVIFEAGKYI
ncbi:MAG TPA: pyruvate kinase [Candidatus Absconditabacterales bacterium]|nr:pyruvate kinase [Candidatus Absconditabacterales bacterium]